MKSELQKGGAKRTHGWVDSDPNFLVPHRVTENISVNLNSMSEGVNINVALFSYRRGLADESRNLEPWTSDGDDTRAGASLSFFEFYEEKKTTELYEPIIDSRFY
ncbi:hypothetical protein TNCV_165821 [Trichonephila clavipes]|nr:hypothetical protein TNCV_165821 [Trichonephila clavipes]